MHTTRVALASLALGLTLSSCSSGASVAPGQASSTPPPPVVASGGATSASSAPQVTGATPQASASVTQGPATTGPSASITPTAARPMPVPGTPMATPTSTPASTSTRTTSTSDSSEDRDHVDTSDDSEKKDSADKTSTPTKRPTATKTRTASAEACRDTTIEPGDEGRCVETAIKLLDDAGYYSGDLGERFRTKAINWTLVYQRAHGLEDNGTIDPDTWEALISGAEEIPDEMPESCYDDGVVLCISKAHHKMRWLRDGAVKKTIQVRVAGWQEDAEGNWRLHETPTGEWEVFDKSRQPCSERYGCKLMPFSTMFDPSMYVHGSKTFAKEGYAGASHGCINALMDDAEWVFDRTPIGAKVVIYAD